MLMMEDFDIVVVQKAMMNSEAVVGDFGSMDIVK
jgi:hypothetical protein